MVQEILLLPLQVKEITAALEQDHHREVAEEVALVRLVQAVAFLGTVELVYLLHYQDQHYHMLVEVGEALT